MQPITSDQRTLLTGDHLKVSAGLEVLDLNLGFIEDISDELAGGSISRNMDARIHGTCRLTLSRQLNWGAVLVRPYMTLSDGDLSARFNLGAYSLTTPERPVGASPALYEVEGYDRLYLLDREVGDTYEVASGVGYLAALRTLISAAGLSGLLLDGTAETKTLPAAMVWPFITERSEQPTTWLRIFNDLAAAVNYRGCWADHDGKFRSEPYATPAVRPPEFTFDADDVDVTIVGQTRTLIEDIWKVPNQWKFVQQNRTTVPTDGDGLYTVPNQSTGPTSIDARGGLKWVKRTVVDVADQASLVAYGDRVVAADKRTASIIKATTGPFPAAGHHDVFLYVDSELGGTRKVQATEWEFDLTGSDVTWTWETV
jgi:hypothetical protein